MGPHQQPRGANDTAAGIAAACATSISVAAISAALMSIVLAERRDRRATLIELTATSQELAAAIAACSDRGRFDGSNPEKRTLPPASRKVPTVLPGPDGARTTPADWSDEVFRCASFSVLVPMRSQVQWIALPRPASGDFEQLGSVEVAADTDGDGDADMYAETQVACSATQCTLGPNAADRSRR